MSILIFGRTLSIYAFFIGSGLFAFHKTDEISPAKGSICLGDDLSRNFIELMKIFICTVCWD